MMNGRRSTQNNLAVQKTVAKHKLTFTMPIQAQPTVLTNTANKVQLIDMNCDHYTEKAKVVS